MQLKRTGETEQNLKNRCFKSETRRWKLCEASFFLRSKQIQTNLKSPRVCQQQEKFRVQFISVGVVSCAVSCISFICFYILRRIHFFSRAIERKFISKGFPYCAFTCTLCVHVFTSVCFEPGEHKCLRLPPLCLRGV